uniref:Activin_recp domain-containing protein n=1 Tax=Steinernema glaseri TaxID=37863 RepID=A0A1I8ANL0_9BILA
MPSLTSLALLSLLIVGGAAIQCYNGQLPANQAPTTRMDCNTLSNGMESAYGACQKVFDYNTNTVTRACYLSCPDNTCRNVSASPSSFPQLHCCCTGDSCNSAHSQGLAAVFMGTLLFGYFLFFN